MAQQPLPPPPNVALISDDAVRDSNWRQWLFQLFNRLSQSGQLNHNALLNLQGGTTNEYYHLTATQYSNISSFASLNNNRVLVTNPTSSVTTDQELTYISATSTLASVNASVSTLGIGLNRGLTLRNQTNSTGASTATMTNSPTAGNPAFWLPISANGSSFVFPLWPN